MKPEVIVRPKQHLGQGDDKDVLSAADIAEMLDLAERTVAETWLRTDPSFPRPFYLSGKIKRWYRGEIRAWVDRKAEAA